MKKTLCFFLTLSMSALCACSGKAQKPETLSPELKTAVTFETAGQTFKADLRREKDGSWQCSFSEPETVKGLTFEKTNGVITLSLGDLNYIADPSQLPESSPVSLIWQAADRIIADKGTKKRVNKKGETEISGTLDGTAFLAKVKKGKLLTLETENEELRLY